MSQNRRLEEALRRTADGTFPLDELHALIHEARPAPPALDGVTAELVGIEAALDDAMQRLKRTTDTLAHLAESVA